MTNNSKYSFEEMAKHGKTIDPEVGFLFLDWVFGITLYRAYTIDDEVRDCDEYQEALRYLCKREGFEFACAMYAYILNTHHKGAFEQLINELIYEENYEACHILKQYQDIEKKPEILNVTIE